MTELVWTQEQLNATTWKLCVDAGPEIHIETEISIPETALAMVPDDQRERFITANLGPARLEMEEEAQRRLAA